MQLSHEKIRPELRHAIFSEDEEAVIQNLAATTADLAPEHSFASRELVDKLLTNLSAPDRLVISLLHLEGRSVEEVRQVTGWSIPLVKVRAFRARRKMKKHLEQLLKEGSRWIPKEPDLNQALDRLLRNASAARQTAPGKCRSPSKPA
jgi:RNA polymerase sigma-70 factor (ECF subfamily)